MTESGPGARVRLARRLDVPALVELRIQYLAEIARMEPRFTLLPDVRARTEHALPVWLGQEERTLLVAEADDGRLLGYATGLFGVWPPVFRHQHVGEISEVYVLPDIRGSGTGRALLKALSEALVRRGAEVLRASVPSLGQASLDRFGALGYRPAQFVLEKSLEEG